MAEREGGPGPSSSALDDDPPARRWRRRALTLPAFHLAGALVWGLLPLWLLLALLRDGLLRNPRLGTVRALAMGAWYLACELLGLQGALWTWVFSGFGRQRASLLAWGYALQRAWVDALFLGIRWIYRLRLEIAGLDELPTQRPFLLFLRHSSLPDVLLPALGWANPGRLALRYVLKVEVCASPCLDVVGHRLPNAFVRRRSGTPEREIARVLQLQQDLGPGQGLVIYPEGTRFSPARRSALLAELEARGDQEGLARARSFFQVLPPRPGGPLALLARRGPLEDLVFCAHTGTEVAWSARDLLDGALLDRVISVRAWRVPAEEIPRDPDLARAFLDAWWHRVDDWVVARQGS